MYSLENYGVGRGETCSSSSLELPFKEDWLNDFRMQFWFLRFLDSSVGKESACNAGELCSIPGLRSAGEGIGYPLWYIALPLWLSWKSIGLQCGRPGFNPWVGKIPWRRKGYPLQCSGLENSMNCIVHEVPKSWIQLSDFHFSLLIFGVHPHPHT